MDGSQSSDKGDELVSGPTVSFKACQAGSHHIKRKAAVHGTTGRQMPIVEVIPTPAQGIKSKRASAQLTNETDIQGC